MSFCNLNRGGGGSAPADAHSHRYEIDFFCTTKLGFNIFFSLNTVRWLKMVKIGNILNGIFMMMTMINISYQFHFLTCTIVVILIHLGHISSTKIKAL